MPVLFGASKRAAVIIVLLLGLFTLICRWQGERIAHWQELNRIVSGELSAVTTFLQRTPEPTAMERRLQQRLNWVQARLPIQQGQEQFISLMQETAAASGIRPVQLAPLTEKTADSCCEECFNLEFKGSYQAVMQFVRSLENGRRWTAVKELQLASEADGLYGRAVIAVYSQAALNRQQADKDAVR